MDRPQPQRAAGCRSSACARAHTHTHTQRTCGFVFARVTPRSGHSGSPIAFRPNHVQRVLDEALAGGLSPRSGRPGPEDHACGVPTGTSLAAAQRESLRRRDATEDRGTDPNDPDTGGAGRLLDAVDPPTGYSSRSARGRGAIGGVLHATLPARGGRFRPAAPARREDAATSTWRTRCAAPKTERCPVASCPPQGGWWWRPRQVRAEQRERRMTYR